MVVQGWLRTVGGGGDRRVGKIHGLRPGTKISKKMSV